MTEEEFHHIINPDILRAISDYEDRDPAELALELSHRENWPSRAVVEQVACRQKAKTKLPTWLTHSVLLDNTALQQASSEATSRYKATLDSCKGKTAIDITGGLGVDATALSGNFETFYYVDQNPVMCLLAGHNFRELGLHNIEIDHCDGLEKLSSFPDDFFDLVYADPSRRKGSRRVISLQNSIPDIPNNLELLKRKAKRILIKLSPVMDITETVRLLPGITVVDVVSHRGECRELLAILDTGKTDAGAVTVRATQLHAGGDILYSLKRPLNQVSHATAEPVGKYLYNPDPAFIKAGMEDILCDRLDLFRLNPAVIYLTSDVLIPSFPGKIYETKQLLPAHTREISAYLKKHSISRANIATRSFPETPDSMYKRLKLKHGGNDYLFFTTDHNDQYIMIHSVPVEISPVIN